MDSEKTKESGERLELIKKLSEIHPAILKNINSNLAEYVGGMADTGGLKYHYCLFEASLDELRDALSKVSEE